MMEHERELYRNTKPDVNFCFVPYLSLITAENGCKLPKITRGQGRESVEIARVYARLPEVVKSTITISSPASPAMMRIVNCYFCLLTFFDTEKAAGSLVCSLRLCIWFALLCDRRRVMRPIWCLPPLRLQLDIVKR